MDLLLQVLETNPLSFEKENCISKTTYDKTIKILLETYFNNLSNTELRTFCRENGINCGAIPTDSLKKVFSKRLAVAVLDQYLQQGGNVGPEPENEDEGESDEPVESAPIVNQPRRRVNNANKNQNTGGGDAPTPSQPEIIPTEDEIKPNTISAKSLLFWSLIFVMLAVLVHLVVNEGKLNLNQLKNNFN